MRLTIAVVALLCALVVSAAGAQAPAPLRVFPNGTYVLGVNAVVVQGGGTAAEAAARVQADSGRRVDAIWLLQDGQWRYHLPPQPFVQGGLAQFGPTPMAAFVVLAQPGSPALDRARKVVLDPGHGADEIGAAENGVVEKHSNFDLALRVEALLQAQGVRVVLTRRSDSRSILYPTNRPLFEFSALYADLQARVNLANLEAADLFVSIHSNSSTEPVRGVEVWYDPKRPFADRNIAFARLLLNNVLAELRAYGYEAVNRGLKDDTCFRLRRGVCSPLFVIGYEHEVSREEVIERGGDPAALGFAPGQHAIVTQATRMPGALVELLFVSDPSDAAVLRDNAGRDALARGVAKGILEMLAGGSSSSSAVSGAGETPNTASPSGRAEVVSRGPSSGQTVALTFDAGADTGYAASILDTLKTHGVVASFGMTGRWAEQNPELLQRIVLEGHQLINHTYSHSSFTGLSSSSRPLGREQRWRELDRTEEIVRTLTGASTKPYFRPPYGDYDASVNADVYAVGYSYNVMWTVDSMGWRGISAGQIVARCLSQTGPGSILIFHVGAASQDAAALPAIIAGLQERGYGFATVAQLLEGGRDAPDRNTH